MKHCKLQVFNYKLQKSKGASLLLTLIILSTILVIALGISNLIWGEIKLSQDIPKSLKAYYAAEAGIERSLYDDRQGVGADDIDKCSVRLNNESSYGVDVTTEKDTTTIKSWGCFRNVKRAIEISYDIK